MSARKNLDAKTILSTVASIAASAMLIQRLTDEFLPHSVRGMVFSGLQGLSNRFSSLFTIVIEEFHGPSRNEVFDAVELYLDGKIVPSAQIQRIRLGKAETDKCLATTMDENEEVIDSFDGVLFRWRLNCIRVESSDNHPGGRNYGFNSSETRSYELMFHKKHKEMVLNEYLPYILQRSKVIKEERKSITFHSSYYGRWSEGINLDHPMSFETLAMDSAVKRTVMEDLDQFLNGKEHYRKVGRAWKRGYLLYGPPGTGKSSLIAAMANHLNFDIYNLDLTNVDNDSCLQELLLSMSSRCILVVEDIDCTLKLQNREQENDEIGNSKDQVTLSGLLNFIDGLCSSCGEERIFVFTTNHKDRLDPALLRPGRMDLHVHMSYCTASAFRLLALNYLGLDHHELFERIEGLLEDAEATPAEVAGEIMKSSDGEASLRGLVEFLRGKAEKKTVAGENGEVVTEVEDADGPKRIERSSGRSSAMMQGRSRRKGRSYRGRALYKKKHLFFR